MTEQQKPPPEKKVSAPEIASSASASASSSGQPSNAAKQFGKIVLDISNSVIPLDKLNPTPSSRDGLDEEAESQVRSLGCDLIQIAGKLLRLPQASSGSHYILHEFINALSSSNESFFFTSSLKYFSTIVFLGVYSPGLLQ